MRPGGSSAKGAAFERQVCRELSGWLSGGVRDDIFWRTAMSGGRATIGLRQGRLREAQAGDVQALDKLGLAFMALFSIECKHVKTLQLGQMLAKKSGKVVNFWGKHRHECKQYKREPFMVARENRYPTLLFTSHAGLELLGLEYMTFRALFKGRVLIPVKGSHEEVCILDWGRFLAETLPPTDLKFTPRRGRSLDHKGKDV